MLNFLEALEITEPSVVAGAWSLCLLLDGLSVLPFRVHEADLVLADYSGPNVVSCRAEVVVQFVLRAVVVS